MQDDICQMQDDISQMLGDNMRYDSINMVSMKDDILQMQVMLANAGDMSANAS